MRKITALVVLVAVVGCKDSKVAVDLQGIPKATQSQRYQLVANPHPWNGSNTEMFLIDTERGRVWEYHPAHTGGKKQYSSHFSSTHIIDEEGILGLTREKFFQYHDILNQMESPESGAKTE